MDPKLHLSLCQRGELEQLRQAIEVEPDPFEKEYLWISTFHLMDGEAQAAEDVTLQWGEDYLSYVCQWRSPQEPFDQPDWKILSRMATLFEGLGRYQDAARICAVAEEFGISNNRTPEGFPGHRLRLQELALKAEARNGQAVARKAS